MKKMNRLALLLLLLLSSLASLSAEVHVLTDETFASSLSQGSWLVSFYAPWCHHCKKLEPLLEQVSSSIAAYEDVRIGKIDATKEKRSAEKMQVDRFPTVLYAKSGHTGRYEGPRTFEGIKHFLDRMHAPAWRAVGSAAELRHGLQTLHNVSFVLALPAHCLHDNDNNEKNNENNDGNERCTQAHAALKRQFISVAEKQQFHAAFAILAERERHTHTQTHTAASLCKYESTPLQEELLYCMDPAKLLTDNANNNEKEKEEEEEAQRARIEEFVVKNNYPVLSEFENHNFKVFAHLNKTMVIAVLDYAQQGLCGEVVSLLEGVSRRVPQEHRSEYIFGHLDGKRWKTFIRHHEASVPSLLLVDHDDERHANIPLSAKDIAAVESVIDKDLFAMLVGETAIPFKQTVPPTLLQKMKHRFDTYYPWSVIFVALPVLLVGVSLLYPYPQTKKVKTN